MGRQPLSLRSGITLCLGGFALLAAGIGVLNHKRQESAQHFLHTNRDLSFWVIALSFLAANCSALEILTMTGVAVKYGMTAVNFYWIGAVPGIAFLICVLLPRYDRLGIRSIPEYFGLRFGHSARLLSAASFCLLMVAVAGITLCVAGQLLHFTLGWSFSTGVWLLTAAAAAFLLAGGLSAVLYADALQLLIFLLVLVPLTVMTIRSAGSLGALIASLPDAKRHALSLTPLVSPRSFTDLFGSVIGLGVVLGFSYWSADFLLIQRLAAARNSREMLNTPGLTIAAKLLLPLLLVVPGLRIASRYGDEAASGRFDLSLPRLLLDHYSGPFAAIAMATMIASLFFGICSNVSAGVAIFTSDVYKPLIRQPRPDRHYLNTGRSFTVLFAVLSGCAAHFALGAGSLMEYIQLVLSSLNVPIATVLLISIFATRLPRSAGSAGLLAGTAVGLLNLCLAPFIRYGSGLSESFYGAVFAAGASALAMGAAALVCPGLLCPGLSCPGVAGYPIHAASRGPRRTNLPAGVAEHEPVPALPQRASLEHSQFRSDRVSERRGLRKQEVLALACVAVMVALYIMYR